MFCIRNKEAFQSWAEAKNKEEMRLQNGRENKRRKTKRLGRNGKINGPTYFGSCDVDEETLH